MQHRRPGARPNRDDERLSNGKYTEKYDKLTAEADF
jgi:hypothetical protein